jgi:hypothetical protein
MRYKWLALNGINSKESMGKRKEEKINNRKKFKKNIYTLCVYIWWPNSNTYLQKFHQIKYIIGK